MHVTHYVLSDAEALGFLLWFMLAMFTVTIGAGWLYERCCDLAIWLRYR